MALQQQEEGRSNGKQLVGTRQFSVARSLLQFLISPVGAVGRVVVVAGTERVCVCFFLRLDDLMQLHDSCHLLTVTGNNNYLLVSGTTCSEFQSTNTRDARPLTTQCSVCGRRHSQLLLCVNGQ